MKITPLALHAMVRVPALTDLFSDILAVDTIGVVAGGKVTINCSSAHGLSGTAAVAITDALTPNPVTDAEKLSNGDVRITTEHDHDLTTAPPGYQPWHEFAKLQGFDAGVLNGDIQLVSVESRTQFTVRPSSDPGTITLNDSEELLERLEFELVGWHAVTVVDTVTLEFDAPATITRSYTVTAPKVVTRARIFGAVDIQTFLRHYSREDGTGHISVADHTMVITPIQTAQLSKDRRSQSAALVEAAAGSVIQQLLLDGFNIYFIAPTENDAGAVKAVDLAQGEVFQAVLRSFNGLALPYRQLDDQSKYVAWLDHHGVNAFDGVHYLHEYVFQAPSYITQGDTITPPDFVVAEAENGAIEDEDLYRVGAPALRELLLDGITLKGKPQPLTATIEVDEE
ncbi:MAG: hypothetical protein ACLFU3_08560 [Dichotomicrobium sp.]